MSRDTPPPLTKALQSALAKAYQLAKSARHEFITLEHLLLGLLEDGFARQAIAGCGGDPQLCMKDADCGGAKKCSPEKAPDLGITIGVCK